MNWIKTKDQRPEDCTFVLAYGDRCQGWVDGPKMAVFYWQNETWWDANMDAELAEGAPTHWMPLPEPPSPIEKLPLGISWSEGKFIYNTLCLNAKRKVVVQTDTEKDEVLYLVYRDDRQFVEECCTLFKAMHVFNES